MEKAATKKNTEKVDNKDKPNKKPVSRYFSDVQLLRRVKKYLEEKDFPEKIDADSVVEDLRLEHKLYARRNKSAFRSAVVKAHVIIMEEKRKKGSANNSDSEVDADRELPSGEECEEEAEEEEEEDEEMLEEEEEEAEAEEEETVEVEDDDEPNATRNVGGRVSYLDSVEKMTNGIPCSGNDTTKKQSNQEFINISSDEEEVIVKKKKTSGNYPPGRMHQKAGSVIFDPLTRPQITVTQTNMNNRKRHWNGGGNGEAALRYHTASTETQTPRRRRDIKGEPSFVWSCDIPSLTFKDIGGCDKVLKTVKHLLLHISHGYIFDHFGVTPPRGFLLHGPPGCGKTLLANAAAGELGIPLVNVSAPALVDGVSGESESRIRTMFELARERAPSILFIDEIDVLCPPRDMARKGMENRIVAQLATCLDELGAGDVVVLGATNRPDALDPCLRRAGRFDREVCMGIPDRAARQQILTVLTSRMKVRPGLPLEELAAATPGFVGADLKALMAESIVNVFNRIMEKAHKSTTNEKKSNVEPMECEAETDANADGESCKKDAPLRKEEEAGPLAESFTEPVPEALYREEWVELEDILGALKRVQPSAKREGFITVPNVTWEDVGSLQHIREELSKFILMPIKHPVYEKLGIRPSAGVLLCGPPGCGKTLLAKAIANEANINFISVKGPELLNMYVGESERAVRLLFQRARSSQPCVIFFDELDALMPRRAAGADGHVSSRVVNQLLIEMDGVESREGVYLMAATNRPEILDSAALRPGRLDKILYVGFPSSADRVDILKALLRKVDNVSPDVNLEELAAHPKLDGFTGADLGAMVQEAVHLVLQQFIQHNDWSKAVLTQAHLLEALEHIRPSVTQKDRAHYETIKLLYGTSTINSK